MTSSNGHGGDLLAPLLPAGEPVEQLLSKASFTEGLAFAPRAFRTWWIPLLIILGLWRHVQRQWPLSYEPTLRSIVIPLGMYSVATLTFGRAARLWFMHPIARVMLWVAVAAWALVGVAFLARIAREFELPRRPSA